MARFEIASRLKKLPPYLFAEIDKKKKAAIAAGRDVINLGVGDPDTPTPDFIIEALAKAAQDPATHQYALDNGDPAFRREIAAFMKRRYGVSLDPDSEVYPTIGSKEAIAHFPLAFIEPGDMALIPDPCYPPYRSGVIFAGGVPVYMDLKAENDFFPDFGKIDPRDASRAKILYLNYPNSPTGKLATREFFREAVAFAEKYNLIIVQDAAYAEMSFSDPAISILEIPGAKERAVEFHSMSKTFNMTGWRVGFAVGSAELMAGLGRIKTNVDSGIFTAIQRAATEALRRYDEVVPGMTKMYRERRDVFVAGLKKAGWDFRPPEATFYCWIPCPKGWSSTGTCARLLEEADIVTTPGNGFGTAGEGYIRATLTVKAERLAEAAARIGRLSWKR
ncbi:MAG: LL-diaminopimelate aminotransferase [Planctomycetota bacterium]|nr:LL-diaminopimelate aminotransferase [Planctomycetota bacterium]